MPTVVGACVIEREGRVLLVEESKDPVAGRWNLPAGRLDEGETPVECARREAREETGLRVTPTRLVGIYREWSPAVDGEVLVFGFQADAEGGPADTPAADSVVDVAWVDPDDLEPTTLRAAYVERAIADARAGRGCDADIVVDLT